MTSDLTIRPFEADDMPALQEVRRLAFAPVFASFRQIVGDTDLTADAGKTSASRQTFVTGKAAQLAGEALRRQILRLANAGAEASLHFEQGRIVVHDGSIAHPIDLATLAPDARGYVLSAEETFDPPTSPLDADGQGAPKPE